MHSRHLRCWKVCAKGSRSKRRAWRRSASRAAQKTGLLFYQSSSCTATISSLNESMLSMRIESPP